MADVVVAGAAGRMGSRLVALLQQETELRLVAALEAPGHPALGRDAGESAGVGRLGIPIGADVDAVLGKDRILIEFSVPEASLAHARQVGRHGGSALRMAEVVAQALGRDLATAAVYDRHDRLAERTRKEIGMSALRSGDVVGEHTVSFASLGERLELTHRAHSRDNFALGALRGARFIATARPGLYSMQDVLGLA